MCALAQASKYGAWGTGSAKGTAHGSGRLHQIVSRAFDNLVVQEAQQAGRMSLVRHESIDLKKSPDL